MTFGRLVAFIFAMIGFVGCGDDDGPSATSDSGGPLQDAGPLDRDAGGSSTNVPGRHDVELEVDGATRRLVIYVPEQAAGDVAAPVVFMVHGTAQTSDTFFGARTMGSPDGSAWRAKADEEGIILVFPQALTYCYFNDENMDGDFDDDGERSVESKWSSGLFVSQPLCTAEELATVPPGLRALADHPVRDDVAFFAAMIDLLESDYVIDSRRVYATGFSNGGQMTSRLAVEMSDRFAAISSSSGFLELGVETRAAERPIPIAVSMGTDEPAFIASGGPLPLDESIVSSPRFTNIVGRYLTVTQLEDVYAHDNYRINSIDVSRFSYTTSAIGADNRLEIVVLGGFVHVYPPIENQLWEFFQRYSLP